MNTANSVGFNLLSISSSSQSFAVRALGASLVGSALSSLLFGVGSAQCSSTEKLEALVTRNAISPAAYSPFICPSSFPFGAPAQVKEACRPTPLDAYFGGIEESVKPPLEKTPQYVHQYLHPGVSYSPNGKFGYPLEKGIQLTQSKLNEYHNTIQDEFKKNPTLKKQVQTLLKSGDPDSKGFAMSVVGEAGSPLTILIGVSPLKMKNHKEAISSLRSWAGRIRELSPQDISAKLMEAHELLFKGIGEGGRYRDEDACIFKDNDEDQDRSFEGLKRLLLSRGGSKQDVRVLKNIFKKMAATPPDKKRTDEEKKVLSFLCTVIPDFETIPDLMQAFATEIKNSIQEMERCKKHDPLALAAFVHRKIGEIHPFSDGNGRMARAFMNAILMENGIDPVIFTDDDAYTAAIEEEIRKPGYFATYLRTVAIPHLSEISQFLTKA